ncbi:hypothetical protein FBU30_004172 [Linnemannia zychae]|nr:hypothetical protein FBU30_004172 [Linnemannia zychae]
MLHIPYVAPGAYLLGAFYNQLSGALIYGPLFGKVWVDAMNRDKGSESWMDKDKKQELPVLLIKEFFLNLSKAWVTGLLLNLTQARTCSQAAQLGAFLFFGVQFPSIISESMWEKRPCDLQKFKALSAFSNTVILSLIMHWWGTA